MAPYDKGMKFVRFAHPTRSGEAPLLAAQLRRYATKIRGLLRDAQHAIMTA